MLGDLGTTGLRGLAEAFVFQFPAERTQGGVTCTSGPAATAEEGRSKAIWAERGQFHNFKAKNKQTNGTIYPERRGTPIYEGLLRGATGSPPLLGSLGHSRQTVPSTRPKPLSHLDASRTLGRRREEATEQGLAPGTAWPGHWVGGFSSSPAAGP